MFMLVLLFIFFTAGLLYYGLYVLLFEKRAAVRSRLAVLEKGYTLEGPAPSGEKQENLLVRRFSQAFIRSSYYQRLQKKLLQAYIKIRPAEFVELSLLLGLVFTAVLLLVGNGGPLILLGFGLGFYLPTVLLSMIGKKRAKQLNDQLPQALAILSNGLRAGFSFPQAMSIVSREMEAPIAEEFARILRENAYGKPLDNALEDFNERIGDEDVEIFVTTLIVQLQVGGDLAEILDTISSTIRERIVLKGEIRTLTSQSKLSAVVISLLPIAIGVVLYLMNPEYIGLLFSSTIGLLLVGACAVMLLIGIFILKKMVDIKV